MSDPVDDLMRFLTGLTMALLAACVIIVFLIIVIPRPEDKRLYTVEVNGVKYENLTFVDSYKTREVFKTQDGKRFEVNGAFVKVEQ